MHRATRFLAGIITVVGATTGWAAQGEGLTANPDSASWARWQGRVSFGNSLPKWHAGLGEGETSGLKVDSLALMGDYYLGRSLAGHGANVGLRTTGGVFYGPRSQLTGSRPLIGARRAGFSIDRHLLGSADANGSEGADFATLPYLGIGYTGLSAKGRWAFNADLGMLALSPGKSVKLGKVVGGTQTLDDLVREMRLAPVLQLGVSYSF
jgi:hypothetical protein